MGEQEKNLQPDMREDKESAPLLSGTSIDEHWNMEKELVDELHIEQQGTGTPKKVPQGGTYPSKYPPSYRKRPNSMATASLILGVLSLASSIGGLGGMVFGGLGITFAILSRETRGMDTTGKVGLGLSVSGLILGIFILVAALLEDPLSTYQEFSGVFRSLE